MKLHETARRTAALALALAALSGADAQAQCVTTVPAGTLNGATWNAAGSPYCVTGNLLVNGLTIEPGVHVQFEGNFELEVAGILSAVGTAQNPIVFEESAANPGGWQGILFQNSLAGSELAYVTVEDSIESGIEILNSFPTIRDCTIRNNSRPGSSTDQPSNPSGGGGIYTDRPLTITRCTVSGNSVAINAPGGGNKYAYGGGIHARSDLTLIDSTVRSNTATAAGGTNFARGGGVRSEGVLTLTRSVIDSNQAIGNSARGGGVFALGVVSSTNTQFTRNSATVAGGAGYFSTGGLIVHATIANNAANAAIDNAAGTLTIVNSILWNNSNSSGNDVAGATDVSFSDWQTSPIPTTDGNVVMNPLFLDPNSASEAYDVHLASLSPVIDMGTNGAAGLPNDDIDGQFRPANNGFDMGMDEVHIPIGADLTARVESFTSVGFATDITAVIRIENVGDQATGGFASSFWLTDGAGGELLETEVTPGGLAPGGFMTVTVSKTSATSLAGQYLVGFIDGLGSVAEGDETNNKVAIVIPEIYAP